MPSHPSGRVPSKIYGRWISHLQSAEPFPATNSGRPYLEAAQGPDGTSEKDSHHPQDPIRSHVSPSHRPSLPGRRIDNVRRRNTSLSLWESWWRADYTRRISTSHAPHYYRNLIAFASKIKISKIKIEYTESISKIFKTHVYQK